MKEICYFVILIYSVIVCDIYVEGYFLNPCGLLQENKDPNI